MEDDYLFVTNKIRRMHVLHFLDEHGSAKMYEIADGTLLNPPNVSRITKEFKERDLVDFKPEGAAKIYFLTPKGKEIAKRIRGSYGFESK